MTYSIVARDPGTGELGVAVQSHWFSVGPVVPWARPGVGAVATQATAEVAHGPNALALLEQGATANEALADLLATDDAAEFRQLAVVDASGRVAAHTGSECIAFAGHTIGDQFSCQANIMAADTVWGAMRSAFEGAAAESLSQRLLAALEAAEAAGGDLRGRQSAAILVVPPDGERWRTSVELRVDDHPEPLLELRRLLALHRAYELASEADDLTSLGRHDEAAATFERAAELAPDNHELLFWSALGAAQAGRIDEALVQMRRAIELHSGWAQLLPRLGPGVAPAAGVLAERLGLDGTSDPTSPEA